MRIAFFTDSFSPTHDGVASVTDSLARGLRRRGHEVTIFTVGGRGSSRWTVEPDGVRVRRYFAIPAPSYPQYRIALFPWTTLATRPGRFDVVHVHTPGFVGLAGRLAARRWHVPVVGTYHTNLVGMLRGSGTTRISRAFFRRWGRFSVDLCRGCDLATAPTESARDSLLEPSRTPLARSPKVIANGVDTTIFRPGLGGSGWRARRGIGPERVITFLGRLTRDKGVHRFLDAIQGVPSNGTWVALIAGEGPQRPSVEERLADGGSEGSMVRYLGPISEAEKPALLAQTHVFVLLSRSDTSSVALLEAMACGAACVVTSRGGPGEIARSSSVGLVVEPDDKMQAGTAIEQLLNDPALHREQSQRGREWVEAHASTRAMTAEFERSYRAVLGPTPS